MDQRLDISIRAGRDRSNPSLSIRLGQINYTTGYRSALARRSAWQRTLRKVFEKVDFIALPTLQKATAGLPLLNLRIGILEARRASVAKYGGSQFCGQPGAGGARAPARREELPHEPAIDRAATGRGRSAQCGAAGRERGKKVTRPSYFEMPRRCEIGVGKIHVLVDARAIEFRHAVFSRAMHGEIGWNRIVFFITRDAGDIDAADEFAGG